MKISRFKKLVFFNFDEKNNTTPLPPPKKIQDMDRFDNSKID